MYQNETGLEKLSRQLNELEDAWKKFDSEQTKREAEIRRPAKKINVISNEEWDRIQRVYGAYRPYLNAFIDGLCYRDLVTRK